MYAQAYVGTGVGKFNVLQQVFVVPLGADLVRRYTGREYELKVKADNALFHWSRSALCCG